MTTFETLKAARAVGTPLIAITTADPPATIAAIVRGYDPAKAPPILQHDTIRGLQGVNDKGATAAAQLAPSDDVLGNASAPLTNPFEFIAKIADVETRAIVFVHAAGELFAEFRFTQGVANLRDAFKATGRTLVLVDAAIVLPPALASDVFTIDEPLPDAAELARVIDIELANAKAGMPTPPEEPDEATKAQAVTALTGLALFPAEQAIAMSLNSGRLDPEQLWARKRARINATRGLTMDVSGLTFDTIGGLDEIKRHGASIFGGPEPPAVVVRMDEIEKMAAGSRGDTSGTSQDQKGVILREMEDNGWTGLIAVGPPGSGKTAISQAIGQTYGAPTFSFDLGAAKDKLVGGSEQLIRNCMKVIKAVAGQRAYFFATCNDISAGVITPDLLRRFTDGIWYFDLCSQEEKAAIWPIHLAKYGHAINTPRPDDTDWTGAEIRNCCRLAYRRRCSLIEAAKAIVPIKTSSPGQIEDLRRMAAGRFLSASYAGTYRHVARSKVVATSDPRDLNTPVQAIGEGVQWLAEPKPPTRTYGES